MSFQLEKQEGSMAVITVEVDEKTLEKTMQDVYTKNKSKFSIPGFRKGKVPRQMLERMYGKDIFCDDAANMLVPEEYSKVLEETKESIVSDPEFQIKQLEAGKPLIFTATVALKPEFRLGKYKGVSVEKKEVVVTEEDITAEVDKERERNSRTVTIEDRPVRDGDITNIDFTGYIDGVAFEGGNGENFSLTIGSGTFIPGFEEQLIGMNIGDEKDVNVTFPEEYHAEELKGKPAVFHVKLNGISEKQLPDADDDFASEVSEFETLSEYRDSIRTKLTESREAEARTEKENAILDAVIEDSDVEIPEAMLRTQQRHMLNDFAQRLRMQGMDLDTYFMYTGQSSEVVMEEYKPQAEKRIKVRLALEAVVAAENITVSDEDFEAETDKAAKSYGMTKERFLEMLEKEPKAKEQIIEDMACTKAVDFLIEHSQEG